MLQVSVFYSSHGLSLATLDCPVCFRLHLVQTHSSISPIIGARLITKAYSRCIIPIMANRHQSTCVLRLSFIATNPRNRRSASQPLAFHWTSLDNHIVERQTSVRMGFDGSLLCRKSGIGPKSAATLRCI